MCSSDLVADVYAAGEDPIPGVDRQHLVEGLRAHGHRNVVGLERPTQLPSLVHEHAESGDYVVCLGAGNITAWAHALPAELAAIAQKKGAKG